MFISTTKMSRLEIHFRWDYFLLSSIKVIVNSTEWEITVHLHEFDESWMRYAIGRVPDIVILLSGFHDVIFTM